MKMKKFRSEQLKLIHNILKTSKNYSTHQEKVLKSFNLSNEQFNILIILHYDNCKEPLSLDTIQNQMVIATTNTSRLVDKLTEKKLVTRKLDPNNRRKVQIKVTEEGITVLNNANKAMKKYAQKFNKTISMDDALLINKKLDDLNDTILDFF